MVVVGLLLLWPASPVLPDSGTDQASTSTAEQSSSAAAQADRGGDAEGAPEREPAATPLFARRGGLDLHVPAERARLVAYHEASRPAAVEVRPSGRLLTNDNTTKFTPPGNGEGPDYVVLSSRGRPQAATSATDVVLDPGVAVRSPVDGRVVEVRPYRLYGRYDDTRIEIAPEGHPDLRVVLIHVEDVRARVGDEVRAGVTVLAGGAVQFPFSSHVDRFLEPERLPHVHLEVKSLRLE